MSSGTFSQEQLARLAEYMQQEEGGNPLSIQPRAREALHGEIPLSFAQQRLWFLDQLQRGSPAYNISVAYRMTGALNLNVLERSLNEIIKRHEVLRTTFATRDGQAIQVIAPELTMQLAVEDFTSLPLAQRTEEMQRRATAEAREPFSLVEGPLLRAHMFQLSAVEQVLLLTAHHVVLDGWSMNLLAQELGTLYNAYVRGLASPLAPLPVQYADFAFWQREWLQGEVLASELDYWKQQLSDVPPVLELPTDRPRPAVQTFHGELYEFQLPKALSQAVKDLSRQEGCTLFQTLLAVFQVLLHRYTGQPDIVVGSPIANRSQIEIEKLLGFFTNTLVLRGNLGGNPTFRTFLRQVREVTSDAYTHQALPFEKLVDELHLQRDLSYTPLVQVNFALQNIGETNLQLDGLEVCPLLFKTGTTKFDLSLELQESAEGLQGRMQYSTDLFDTATMVRLAEHFQILLAAFIATPDCHIADVSMLTTAEQQQIQKWNATDAAYENVLGLHQLFEAQVERTPNAPAVLFEDKLLSYQELNARANRLAHFLQTQGVGVETCVGICAERSLEMAVGLLGILKAGGTCVPLDPEYPPERLILMMQDTHVPVLLTQAHLLTRLPEHKAVVTCLDTDWERIAQHSAENLPHTHIIEQAAYIIYTSGSTGIPKGVVLQHASVCNRIAWGQMVHPLTAADRVLQEASFSFDFAIWEFFGSWSAGAQVILARPGGQRDIDYLIALIAHHQITILHLIPSLLRVFLEQDGLERCQCVRHVYGGAEPLPFDLWQRFTERMDAQLHNVYGPTEASIDSTCWTSGKETSGKIVPIGKPIANAQVYLLDKYTQLVPIGVPGEVYIGGSGLARGYLNRPELTAERFIPHPFSRKAGARLYRTGDVARYLPDGNIEYVGRADHQVKVRGFRIELGEIEAALKNHPDIREAVAVVREDQPGEKRLVAYLVPEHEQVLSIGELRAFLQEKLPDYMIPTRFLSLAHLPLTSHGKVDRKSLPMPDADRPDLKKSYVAPRTPVEEALAEIWAQVLGLAQIGIYDNFFELGGDSIRSIQIVAHAKTAGLHFSVQQLFRHQTIADLAEASKLAGEYVEIMAHTKPFDLIGVADRQLLPPDIEDAYPLTALQLGMLYHMELTKGLTGSPDYHNVDSFYYRLPFDLAAFQHAVDCTVQRHPVLRTSFDLTNYSEPLQLVHKRSTLVVQAEDLRQHPLTEQERIIKQFVEHERHTYFDMSQPHLLRFYIHQRTDETFQFTVTEFHPILDGWSIHSIFAQIFKRYLALLKHENLAEEAPLTTSFRDFVALEKKTVQSEACRQYWESILGDYERLALPSWSPSDDQIERPRHNKIGFPVPLEVSLGLQRLARSLNVSLKHVLLAVHTRVLNLLSGQADIVTGMLSHGRPEVVDGERVAGLFLNVVPLRLHLPHGSWQDLIQHIFATECALLPFRRYPLAEMQRRWGGRTPLFNTAFSYFDFHVYNELFSSGQMEDLEFRITSPNSGYVLDTLFFAPRRPSDSLSFELVYETAKLGEHDAHRVGDYYIAAMQAMINNPQGDYGQTCLLPVAETTKILTEWNVPPSVFPESTPVHQLFEAQVERTPDALAVIGEGQRLTYRQLNARANQLAHYLRQHAVTPNVLVGFSLERSVDMLVGLLGILKAGGTYVPLDPTYPRERLAFLLKETQISLLITQQHLLANFPDHGATVICLDRDGLEIAQQSTANPTHNVQPQHLAYAMYTSGSTGAPKGVLIAHHALTNYVESATRVYGITAHDHILQFASINFDASVEEIYPCLTQGATLVLRTEAMLASVQTFIQTCQQQGITCMSLPTAYWHELVTQMDAGSLTFPSCVRLVIIGGETANNQHLALWQRATQGRIRLINTYGPTEATVIATLHEVEPQGNLTRTQPTIPIGRPLSHTQVYLLDTHQQPVPVGVAAEIYIGGAGLAQGYLYQPELTAQRFVPHPFSQEPGARLYRTGDLARYLPDGTIEFLGRTDHQVKIRGFRIEPGEIEAILSQHPAVQAVVVLAREDVPGEKQLVAYIVAAKEVIESEWRAYLSKRLPQYMIPSVFLYLDTLPLTSNGKVDRRALPAPVKGQSSTAYVAPRTPVEEQLAKIWAEVLGLERVGVQDNFFDLGGHSLNATQIISRTQQALSVTLSLRSLFEDPTITALACTVEHALEQQEPTTVPILQAITHEEHEDQLLSYLEDLSEDEIQTLLAAAHAEFEH